MDWAMVWPYPPLRGRPWRRFFLVGLFLEVVLVCAFVLGCLVGFLLGFSGGFFCATDGAGCARCVRGCLLGVCLERLGILLCRFVNPIGLLLSVFGCTFLILDGFSLDGGVGGHFLCVGADLHCRFVLLLVVAAGRGRNCGNRRHRFLCLVGLLLRIFRRLLPACASVTKFALADAMVLTSLQGLRVWPGRFWQIQHTPWLTCRLAPVGSASAGLAPPLGSPAGLPPASDPPAGLPWAGLPTTAGCFTTSASATRFTTAAPGAPASATTAWFFARCVDAFTAAGLSGRQLIRRIIWFSRAISAAGLPGFCDPDFAEHVDHFPKPLNGLVWNCHRIRSFKILEIDSIKSCAAVL